MKNLTDTEIWGSGYLAQALRKRFGYNIHKGRDLYRLASDLKSLIILHSQVQRGSDVNYIQNLLDQCLLILKSAEIKRVIFVSTVAVYGYSSCRICDENSPVSEYTTYQLEKLLMEHLITDFCEARGIEFFILRLSNLYGSKGKLITPNRGLFFELKNAILTRDVLKVYHGGRQYINFIHVDDVTDTIARFVDNGSCNSGVYNIASAKSTQLMVIIDQALKLFNELKVEILDDDNEDINSYINTQKFFDGMGIQYQDKWKSELESWKLV